MSNKSNSTDDGVGFWGLLQLLFIALQLTNYIHWSWWWVLSPSLFELGLVIILIIGLVIPYIKVYKRSKQIWN